MFQMILICFTKKLDMQLYMGIVIVSHDGNNNNVVEYYKLFLFSR